MAALVGLTLRPIPLHQFPTMFRAELDKLMYLAGHRAPAQQGMENIQPPLQANRSHSVSPSSFIWTKRFNRPLITSEGYYTSCQTPL
ncbi:hypothetical protein J6590_056677 [Homalodisca vitripennis]|nr:hypothetical protein J6590_056677 [Homalodisca vitripennis]